MNRGNQLLQQVRELITDRNRCMNRFATPLYSTLSVDGAVVEMGGGVSSPHSTRLINKKWSGDTTETVPGGE